jgi:phosphatidylglycerophosphatase A
MSHLLSTFFYIGYLRPAPGTWGSLVAIIIAYITVKYTGYLGLSFAILLAFVIGWITITLEASSTGRHDPSEIVIDEVVGQWISVLPLAIWPIIHSKPLLYWALAFLVFRILDIRKPSLIGWVDRKNTPLSVILDDVIAGLATAAIICLVILIIK